MAYLKGNIAAKTHRLILISTWILLTLFSSKLEAAQPIKSFYEVRLVQDPALKSPLLMECNHVTSRCYGAQQCTRTITPVMDSIWFHNGIRLNMGVHGNQLHYDAAKEHDQGNYQCGSQSSRESISESSTVYFTEPDTDPIPPSIMVDLAGSTWQREGKPFSLDCAGAGANVKKVRWSLGGFTIPKSSNLYSISRVEQGMLQEKTIRSLLKFRPITNQMTCDDLEQYNGIFQCSVEYDVTKAAKDNEPFVIESREKKSSVSIATHYEVSNATDVLEPMMAFSLNVLYLICPLCVLHDVTMVTWYKEGSVIQNSSALSYSTRTADLSQTEVYSCESSGARMEFLVNETFVNIKAEPQVAFSLVYWDRIEVLWKTNYNIPFRYDISMMYVSGSSVRYTNFLKKTTHESQLVSYLDVEAGEDIRFVATTTIMDHYNKNQTLLESQYRQDVQMKSISQEKPYIPSIAFWENEGAMTFRLTKSDLENVKCLKVNLTLTPDTSRSRRQTANEVKVTEQNGVMRADMTSVSPPWSISTPLMKSPNGKPAPLSIIGPFDPGELLVIDAVFYAERSSGVPHVLSQSRNTSHVANAPPTNTGFEPKPSFPWYVIVGIIALLVIVFLVTAIIIHRKRQKRKSRTSLDHGENFDDLDERNMYDYLNYDQLNNLPNAPNLPPRPERQADSWPIPTVNDSTKKYTRPQSEMPFRRPSETEYLLPLTERSKSTGATPACSPIDDKNYLLMTSKMNSLDDEGIGEDSPFIKPPRPELRRPSREERESGYLSMTSKELEQRSQFQNGNNRPNTHTGVINRNDSIPEQSEGSKRATVMPSRQELETMVDEEIQYELSKKDEYISNDDLSNDTILTLPHDESYASHNQDQNTYTNQPYNYPQNSGSLKRDNNFNSKVKPKLSFRHSLIARSNSDRNSATDNKNIPLEPRPHSNISNNSQKSHNSDRSNDQNHKQPPQNVLPPQQQNYPQSRFANQPHSYIAPMTYDVPNPNSNSNPDATKPAQRQSQHPHTSPESNQILSPVKYIAPLPQSQDGDNNENKDGVNTVSSEKDTDKKPKTKKRKKKKNSGNEDESATSGEKLESTSRKKSAKKKHRSASGGSTGTPTEKRHDEALEISGDDPARYPGDPGTSPGVVSSESESPDVHSPHVKSFQKQFSFSPLTGSAADNQTSSEKPKTGAYVSRTETFV